MIVTSGAAAGTYFYHQDALGSVVALSKFDNGLGYAQFVEKYSYSAFGETVVCDGSNTPRSPNQSLYGNPYMFTGRELDTLGAGSWQLYYYRARFYKPEIGRFLQTDPIGYADGLNWYAYCGNNPLAFVDPYGLCKSSNWLDWAQGGLDAIGIIDPFGIADGANTLIYLARGNYVDAGISALAMIPFIGDFAKVGKYGAKVAKYADEALDVGESVVRHSDEVSDFGKTVIGHYPEYKDLAKQLDASYFDIGSAWDTMSDAERLATNMKFIDDAIMRGDDIILATPLQKVRKGTWTEKEIEHIIKSQSTHLLVE